MTRFEEFENIVAKLRSPKGCPWDREQTHFSLKKAMRRGSRRGDLRD